MTVVWYKAYNLHKLEHGSFKYIKEPEYSRKMFERAMFCADNCLEYIIYKSRNETDKNWKDTMKILEFRINGKPISLAKYFDSIYFNKDIIQFVPMLNGILLFLQKINRRLFLRWN